MDVFSHRAAAASSERYLFRRAIPAWQDFVGVVRNSLVGKSVLLSTDLANYFENIDLAVLKATLLDLLPEIDADTGEKAAIRAHIDTLFECLKSWCYSEHRGLPQNRDASSFLANLYMLPVDRAMLALGCPYFRYMDDIKIACDSPFEARRYLKLLSLELRKYGLVVNSGKTQIVPVDDNKAISECLDAGDGELQRIDAIWQTRSLRPISRSFPLLKELTLSKLQAGQVASRAFRYCIRRLETLARCPEFQVPEAYFAEITPLVIAALAEHPASTDELVRYLRAVPTTNEQLGLIADHLRDPNKNFYTWQSYRLWSLLVQKGYRDDHLLAFALDVVRTTQDDAARSGATLYAGAFGDTATRVEIAEKFPELESFIGQRAALVAIQELHFRPHVEAHVLPAVRSDLSGVFRGLARRGLYVAAPEPMSITRVLDVERDYD